MRQHVRSLHKELRAYFATVEIEVIDDRKDVKDTKTEPEPEPDAEPEAKPEPEPREKTPIAAKSAKPDPTADAKTKDDPYGDDPPPAAAEAAAVLHQGDEGDDLTGWTIVNKDGSKSTGGGYTSGNGSAKHAVGDPRASSKGKEGGHGTTGDGQAGAKRVDHSRPAMPLDRRLSDCPFPAQADMEQIDHAVVDVTVTVDATGRATNARFLADPGYGFGGQARRCALSMRYESALDAEGSAIPGATTLPFRFNRQ